MTERCPQNLKKNPYFKTKYILFVGRKHILPYKSLNKNDYFSNLWLRCVCGQMKRAVTIKVNKLAGIASFQRFVRF